MTNPYLAHIKDTATTNDLLDRFSAFIGQQEDFPNADTLRDAFFDAATRLSSNPEVNRTLAAATVGQHSPLRRVNINGVPVTLHLLVYMGLAEVNQFGFISVNQQAITEGMQAAQARAEAAKETL